MRDSNGKAAHLELFWVHALIRLRIEEACPERLRFQEACPERLQNNILQHR